MSRRVPSPSTRSHAPTRSFLRPRCAARGLRASPSCPCACDLVHAPRRCSRRRAFVSNLSMHARALTLLTLGFVYPCYFAQTFSRMSEFSRKKNPKRIAAGIAIAKRRAEVSCCCLGAHCLGADERRRSTQWRNASGKSDRYLLRSTHRPVD